MELRGETPKFEFTEKDTPTAITNRPNAYTISCKTHLRRPDTVSCFITRSAHFKDGGSTLSASDAHGDHAVFPAASAHMGQRLNGQHSP